MVLLLTAAAAAAAAQQHLLVRFAAAACDAAVCGDHLPQLAAAATAERLGSAT
jgi:hypothetical protein